MSFERNALKAEEWRSCRRAFIAACEARGLDAIARVHPARAPDGKPLFLDSAALGQRTAAKALLVVTSDAAGSRLLIALLQDGVTPPPGARLVLVHALDPAAFAGAASDPAWSAAMLRAVVTEDLAKAPHPVVMDLTGAPDENAAAKIKSALAALA